VAGQRTEVAAVRADDVVDRPIALDWEKTV
jgi:hypothetical protein